ncbi:conserved hypothetical protein [Brochothrix thermosphacta]|nr:conserved hypothetical protein [Brochothrix thermosphacta]
MKTGKKTSRAKAAAWLAVGFLPIGKVAKLGKMSAKGFNAVSKGSKAAKSIKKSRSKSSATSKIKGKGKPKSTATNKGKSSSSKKAKPKAASTSKAGAKAKKNTGKKVRGAKVSENLKGPVLDGKRSGSGKKVDNPKSKKGPKEFPNVSKEHGFLDIIDNYSRFADEFSLVGGDGVKRKLFQIEGIYNGDKGVFEWIVDTSGKITHRRFIKKGVTTGKPNQVPKK